MQIASLTAAQHTEFVAIVNAEIRPDRAKTTALDDFPLILGPKNLDWQLVALDENGHIAAGIACLIRTYRTSCGDIPIAGIGSVVTQPQYRGHGLSTKLQIALLKRLKGKNIPLAVLWTDHPEIYSGRGFQAAGWEIHVNLPKMDNLPPISPSQRIRAFRPNDVMAVADLYGQHKLCTLREASDHTLLYTMPGTQGLVLCDAGGQVLAAVFCGKGGDFPDYVAEWDGLPQHVLPLLAEAKNRGWASHVLVPAGAEKLVEALLQQGADWFAQPSGQWAVVDETALTVLATKAGLEIPVNPASATAWLGGVTADGEPYPGVFATAIWGFDSV